MKIKTFLLNYKVFILLWQTFVVLFFISIVIFPANVGDFGIFTGGIMWVTGFGSLLLLVNYLLIKNVIILVDNKQNKICIPQTTTLFRMLHDGVKKFKKEASEGLQYRYWKFIRNICIVVGGVFMIFSIFPFYGVMKVSPPSQDNQLLFLLLIFFFYNSILIGCFILLALPDLFGRSKIFKKN